MSSKLMNQKPKVVQELFEGFPNQLLTNVEIFDVLTKLLWTIISIRFLVHPRRYQLFFFFFSEKKTFVLGYYLEAV